VSILEEIVTEKGLKLLSLNGITELKTGEYVVAANFGEIVDNTPEIAARMDASPSLNPSGPKQIGSATVVIYLKIEHAFPFTVGGKWKLKVFKNGDINLTKE
jgi:hypothetical protein